MEKQNPRKGKQPGSSRRIFILRLWFAPQVEDYVGELLDVSHNQTLHFRSLDELPGCLVKQLIDPAKQTVDGSPPERTGKQGGK